MPDSERFDLINENGKQLDEWETFDTPQFQRKTGEHFIKIGHAMEAGAMKFTDHDKRITINEKHRRAVRIAVLVFITLGGIGFLAGIALAAKAWLIGN